ncbi:hypothetical protein GDO78_021646 [Eleutherodactylus coqui]|uniref:Uncharacterized protein n=1 Tax=Eleutherodactylus coqui TaxID=57060 RepID=A0A8J6C560_ELECQ|nr:hypothetical protein GDO78_021646 [Eleutherodactylus coqui]
MPSAAPFVGWENLMTPFSGWRKPMALFQRTSR